MGMANIKQELWATNIVALLKTQLVAEGICSPNVVPSANGDKMHIIGAGEVTVGNYSDAQDINYQDVTDTDTEFTFNLDKYFAIVVYDTDTVSAATPWQQLYSDRGGYGLVKALDASVFADFASCGLDNYETGSTPWQLGTAGADVPNLFASIGAQLDGADAPQMGRYVVLPAIGVQAIRLYAASKNSAWGDQVLQNGMVGKFMGFDVFLSNNLTTDSGTIHALAGVARESIAWKMQINPTDIETFRAQGRFATLVRGRCRAGHKVFRDTILVDVNLNSTLLA